MAKTKGTQQLSEQFIDPDDLLKTKEKDTTPPIGEVTQEQIDEWKKKYGKVYFIKVGKHICYIKKPTRQILGYAGTVSQVGKVLNAIKYYETLLINCWLGGSEDIKLNDELILGAGPQMAELIEIAESELGEL